MGHGITKNDTMVSVKERPWHGLGTIVDKAISIEEALELSGLNWEVSKGDLFDEFGNLQETIKYTYRNVVENGEVERLRLGYVSDGYTILQNTEALNWFNPLLETGNCSLETAGSLFGGKKIFITAKIGQDLIEIDKNDPIEKFVLLTNSHEGGFAVRVGFTPVRVVCNNTLKMAVGNEASKLIRVKHTLQLHNNLIEVQQTMDLINQQFMATAEQFKLLATRDINQSDLEKYVRVVFNKEKAEEQFTEFNDKEQRVRIAAQINEVFEREEKKNLWTAYNSVQGFLQHVKAANRSSLESRYNNLWYGHNDRMNQKALSAALSMV